MSEVPSVTAIVPTFNRAQFLSESLDSVLAQTMPPTQIIVVDDGSTDDTADVLARYTGRIEVLRQSNAGKASALNHAMGRATAASVWIFDDDDIALPDALERLSAALNSEPEAAFAFGGHLELTVQSDGTRELRVPPAPQFVRDDLFMALLERCFIFQGGMLVRRSAYEEVGPFDAGLIRAQDYEMLLRLAQRFPGVSADGVMFHQRQHQGVRGTAAVPISGAVIWERQKAFDAKILGRMYAQVPLAEYLPRSQRDSPTSSTTQIRALLRRGAAMARKMLWSLAGEDFADASALAATHNIDMIAPSDAVILGRVFDEYSYANIDVTNPLLHRVAALDRCGFTDGLLAALMWTQFRYIVLSVQGGKLHDAARHLAIYRHFRPLAIVRHHLARAVRKPRISN